MLNDFFKLNTPFNTVATTDEFLALLERADALRDLLIQPDELAPQRPRNRIHDKKFTNVSFSKKELRGVEFKRCGFIDCLFIGTHFNECDFHDCTFEGCNLYKARFTACYIDPVAFEHTCDPSRHSNVGVGLFQQLMQNSANTQQPDFSHSAQYLFRKWQRYQYWREFKNKERTLKSLMSKWVPSLLYDHLAGYGIRLFPFVRLTVLLLAALTAANYWAWARYNFGADPAATSSASWLTSFYYTIATMTSLGLNDPGPHSTIGMLASGAQAMLGVIWFSLLASIIVKRVSK